jgi:hypothetical protein
MAFAGGGLEWLLVAAFALGVPAGLMLFVWLLARLEAWTLERDERAAAVEDLLAEPSEAEEIEARVAKMMSQVPVKRRRGGAFQASLHKARQGSWHKLRRRGSQVSAGA